MNAAIFNAVETMERLQIEVRNHRLSPKPELIRGTCPSCGGHLVSSHYYVDGQGYVISWDCWSSLAERPTCSYRHMI